MLDTKYQKMTVREIVCEGVDYIRLRIGPVAVSCDLGSEPRGPINGGKFLDQLLKMDGASSI
jgi:hypothetical protein